MASTSTVRVAERCGERDRLGRQHRRRWRQPATPSTRTRTRDAIAITAGTLPSTAALRPSPAEFVGNGVGGGSKGGGTKGGGRKGGGGGGDGGGGDGGGGGRGRGEGGGRNGRGPQSTQSVPYAQLSDSDPGPPSSQEESEWNLHVLKQSAGADGGGDGGAGGGEGEGGGEGGGIV